MSSGDNTNEDCWYGVEDARKRKKIQDKLAQRARRRRLAEARALSTNLERKHQRAFEENDDTQKRAISSMDLQRAPSPVVQSIIVPRTQSPPPLLSSVADYKLLPVPFFSLAGAMLNNGRMLGLNCGFVIPSKSTPAPLGTPVSLQPTELQLDMMHSLCFDRFPFPRMRDNLISLTLTGIVDEEEFIGDLFDMQSFSITPGKMSWDPDGWRIGSDFKEKWQQLFV